MGKETECAVTGFVLLPGENDALDIRAVIEKRRNGRVEFVAVGHSMEPTLLAGDRVQVEKVSGKLRTGWVVVFSWGNKVLTHRVVEVRGGMFWARGDASVPAEGPVPVSEVIGRIVSYHRDGRWHSLEGFRQQIFGLVYNKLMSRIRWAAMRWPGLRRVVEVELLNGRWVRSIYRKIGQWLYGPIIVQEDRDPFRVLGTVVSNEVPLTQQLLENVEKQVGQGDLKLLVAYSTSRGRIGNALLCRAQLKCDGSTGYISSLVVSLGARGMGVGRRLLSAAEAAARAAGMGRVLALVTPNNVRSRRLFQSMGYQVVSTEELERRSREERESVPEGKLLLEKLL